MKAAVLNRTDFGLADVATALTAQMTDAARRYIRYRRTYAALNALENERLSDLGLNRGILEETARSAARAA